MLSRIISGTCVIVHGRVVQGQCACLISLHCDAGAEASTQGSAGTLRLASRGTLHHRGFSSFFSSFTKIRRVTAKFRLTLYTLPYWSNPLFLIFDTRTLWPCRCFFAVSLTPALSMYGAEPCEQLAALEGLIVSEVDTLAWMSSRHRHRHLVETYLCY